MESVVSQWNTLVDIPLIKWSEWASSRMRWIDHASPDMTQWEELSITSVIDFVQLPPFHGYKYVLVIVCMFSQWTEAFPCRQAIASSVAKVLLEKIISAWGSPLKLYSDWGSHFLHIRFFCVCQSSPKNICSIDF